MLFSVVNSPRQILKSAKKAVFLIEDNWDDWGKFRTVFEIVVFDHSGKRFEPGSIKLGEFGLKSSGEIQPGYRSPTLERMFDTLDDRYFSLGTDETYYETLNQLPGNLQKDILLGLKDCAFDLKLFDKAIDEEVMQESLLRGVTEKNVRNRLHRLARGDAKLTEFHFKYIFPEMRGDTESPVLDFHVLPNSMPPTNVHVLIGRNGVGKTYCMQHLSRTLLGESNSGNPVGKLLPIGDDSEDWSFAGLIAVSFSAFDNFDLPQAKKTSIRYAIIGLRQSSDDKGENVSIVKTPKQLAKDFSKSFKLCRHGLRVERWRSAVATLEKDPLFAEANITDLLELNDKRWSNAAEKLFSRLSSGHAIVLLTITRLVELVDEKTIVLLDEPESHLHPPLLSAFIRSLSNLLFSRNGVAIIATHSPVVLQEVPKLCVWMLRRTGGISNAERPILETFGENVGVLTREVFGLEVTNSGYHSMLRYDIEVQCLDYEDVVLKYKDKLGAEARAIVRGLIANRDEKDQD
jgi:ABC-type cobalamin/Fe3+-siderophores transport system ATPase subunit